MILLPFITGYLFMKEQFKVMREYEKEHGPTTFFEALERSIRED